MTSDYLAHSAGYYRTRKALRPWIYNLALIAICALMLAPVIGTLLTSLKRQIDVEHRPPVLLPCDTPTANFDITACHFVLEGYQRIIDPQPAPNTLFGVALNGRMISIYLPNTILYAVVSSLLVTVFAGMAGYAFSRFNFRLRRTLMVALLAITGVPLLTNLIALYQMGVWTRREANAISMALTGAAAQPFTIATVDRTYLILVYIGFFLPFSIWVVKSFFDTIPRELEEASFIDGCSPLMSLWLIVVPLATPGLTSAFLLSFVGVWNEFIAGYLLVSNNALKTAMFGLYDFISQFVIGYQVLAAACILLALPVVLLFLFARPVFFRAMVEGALKG
jgi:ABC-type glycerol-3-phosphate transport system permease component